MKVESNLNYGDKIFWMKNNEVHSAIVTHINFGAFYVIDKHKYLPKVTYYASKSVNGKCISWTDGIEEKKLLNQKKTCWQVFNSIHNQNPQTMKSLLLCISLFASIMCSAQTSRDSIKYIMVSRVGITEVYTTGDTRLVDIRSVGIVAATTTSGLFRQNFYTKEETFQIAFSLDGGKRVIRCIAKYGNYGQLLYNREFPISKPISYDNVSVPTTLR
jgi:hypothetical protein